MNRVSILVTHLLGTGHLSRMLTLATAMRAAGLRPQIISGGRPVAHLASPGVDIVQLPPVCSDGANFRRLLDEAGDPATPALMQRRAAQIVAALRDFDPKALITELFPFGRRSLSAEFEAAVKTVRANDRRLVLASIRDILAPPSNEAKARQAEAWLADYDGVLVHSDPAVVPLEASWPVTAAVGEKLLYTGFIAADTPPNGGGGDGAGEILVTAGGGPVGRKLFDTAIEAARLGTHRFRLLVGGADAAALCERLAQVAAGAPVIVEPARADYRAMLANCAAAVGQCGYNTALDWLQSGVPGVFVPFAEAGEVEQTLRAASLRQRYGYGVIAEDELTARNLAEAADLAVRRGRRAVTDLKLDGAAETSRILLDFLARR